VKRLESVLVVGNGGREHALAWAIGKDPEVGQVHIAPGNPGTAAVGVNHPVDALDGQAVAALAQELAADLVVVGPEGPLVAGVADAVRAAGIPVFGPSAAAALDEFGPPYVVKNDSLAAGKGVVVTADREQALQHAQSCGQVVIEEYLDGPEVSLFALSDGVHVLPFEPAQDFKRVGDGDTGPNTGGMGAYTPLPWAPAGLTDEVVRTVVQPTVDELRSRGIPFVGLVYAGLALTSRGVRVVEFNARFGDPETQPLLRRLRTTLGQVLHAAATGGLAGHPPLEWGAGATCAVVLAAEGYPGTPRRGDVITGGFADHIFHAGTALSTDGDLVTAGGRVLAVVGSGDTLAQARDDAYAKVGGVHFDGGFHRDDIAAKAVNGEIVLPESYAAPAPGQSDGGTAPTSGRSGGKTAPAPTPDRPGSETSTSTR
jgi:phosphoribosylamine--glycine ligase